MEWSWKFNFIWGSILLSLRITHQIANLARGGVAAQSSYWDRSRSPMLLIDGKSNTHYHYGSCVSTLWEENPWWRVDLRAQYDISTIEVTRRTDCCIQDLQGTEIRIGNSLENNGNNNPRCAVISNISQIITNFNCSQMRGRYINFFHPGVTKILQLCEVKVFSDTYIGGADVARGGVAAQSSVHHPSYPPSLVIDGKSNSHYADKSCVATNWEEDPWWRLDLKGPYVISSILVIRRSDCCRQELQGAEVRIGNSLDNNGNNNTRCAVITDTRLIRMVFNCNRRIGRYVNIFIPGVNRRLQLCEVKVFATTSVRGDNVARRGIATQSGEPASNTTGPHFAIDGRTVDTCASVPLQNNPLWKVDLRSIYHITAVSVFTLGDCCSSDLRGAEVRIGLRNDISNQRCAIIYNAKGQRRYNYHCGVMEGRFVHIVRPGQMKNLTVCEVFVFGTVLENVALRGIAFQTSSRDNTTGQASKVIDGYRFGVCSMTEYKPGQSVTVDLLVPYNVTLIQLAYNWACCHSDEVRVDNTSCRVVSSSAQLLMIVDCGGIVGRYVTVIHPDTPAPLCEVEVYSTWVHPHNRFPQRPPRHVDYCPFKFCHRDYVLIHKPKTWFEAQAYCREKYTDLATINTVQGMNRVIDKAENDLNDIWIGLYEDAITWRWSLADEGYYGDGEAEFRSWGVGESNETSSIQHCAGIQHSGEWKDLDCDLLNYFLCFDGREQAPETKILVETPMKWSDAQSYCREQYTDLLSVRNQTENEEIQSLVPEGKLVWIGLFRDSWKWSDGSYSSFRYRWQEPPDSSGEGPNCAYIYNRKWRVRSCDTKSMFLCYYYKKRSVVRISSDSDMSDPVIQQQILSQLEAQMKNKGFSDFKISWRISFQTGTTQPLVGGSSNQTEDEQLETLL